MKLITIVKNGRRIDVTKAQLEEALIELQKGGPGSGRYPKGSGEEKEETDTKVSKEVLTNIVKQVVKAIDYESIGVNDDSMDDFIFKQLEKNKLPKEAFKQVWNEVQKHLE